MKELLFPGVRGLVRGHGNTIYFVDQIWWREFGYTVFASDMYVNKPGLIIVLMCMGNQIPVD